MLRPEFQKEMGTREYYYHLGKVINEYEQKSNIGQVVFSRPHIEMVFQSSHPPPAIRQLV